ncbi:MAG: hypothetical protein QM750_09285 [Rubrivivax sp.]
MPAIVQSLGSFSGTSAGGASLAATAATLPKLVRRPLAAWLITPFSARHSAAGTFHASAAACTSISRAVAPPLRARSRETRGCRAADRFAVDVQAGHATSPSVGDGRDDVRLVNALPAPCGQWHHALPYEEK